MNDVMPKNEILQLDEWKWFLRRYDKATSENGGLREVFLSGGEPTTLPYFIELCHWILFEKRWHLVIFTNLSTYKLLDVKPSVLLRIEATLHSHVNPVVFDKIYRVINKVHRVEVVEFIVPGKEKILPYSRTKRCLGEEEAMTTNKLSTSIRVASDLSIHLTCWDAYKKFC